MDGLPEAADAVSGGDCSAVPARCGTEGQPTTKHVRHPFDTIIIAAGDEDFSARDIYEWVLPLLRGMSNASWSVCLFELKENHKVIARFQEHSTRHEHVFQTYWKPAESAEFRNLIPETRGLVIFMVNECSSQVFILVDTVARWLGTFPSNQQELEALNRLFAAFNVVMIHDVA
jgi:hypothetical protein